VEVICTNTWAVCLGGLSRGRGSSWLAPPVRHSQNDCSEQGRSRTMLMEGWYLRAFVELQLRYNSESVEGEGGIGVTSVREAPISVQLAWGAGVVPCLSLASVA
jgi:hypothetical protein